MILSEHQLFILAVLAARGTATTKELAVALKREHVTELLGTLIGRGLIKGYGNISITRKTWELTELGRGQVA